MKNNIKKLLTLKSKKNVQTTTNQNYLVSKQIEKMNIRIYLGMERY